MDWPPIATIMGTGQSGSIFMYENEILVFLLGSVVWLVVGLYRRSLRNLPAVRWLYASYAALWLAWGATNLEHLLLEHLFNLLEHAGYAANGLLLLGWCWVGMKRCEAAHDA